MSMAYMLYILQSDRDGTFYIGHTACLAERLLRHNEGRSRYTRTKIPWSLVYKEEYATRSEAIKRERELKRKKSCDFIKHLVTASRL
jgi:putative endonuclease